MIFFKKWRLPINLLHDHGLPVLSLSSLVLLGLFFRFGGQPTWQLLTIVALVIIYLLWALIHHLFEKNLSLEIFLEYCLTALLVIIMVYGLLT